MYTRQKIAAIVAQLTPAPLFTYQSRPEKNFYADNEDFTNANANLVEIETGTFALSSIGNIRDTPDAFIQFTKMINDNGTDGLDATAEQGDAIVDEMKALAIKFIQLFDESGAFEQITSWPYVVIIKGWDINAYGVELRFRPVEIYPDNICL